MTYTASPAIRVAGEELARRVAASWFRCPAGQRRARARQPGLAEAAGVRVAALFGGSDHCIRSAPGSGRGGGERVDLVGGHGEDLAAGDGDVEGEAVDRNGDQRRAGGGVAAVGVV